MVSLKELFKKHVWDATLVLILAVVSCGVLAYYVWPRSANEDVLAFVYVSAKKQELEPGRDFIDLSRVGAKKNYLIQGKLKGESGRVVVTVEPGKISISESGCPNQYCVRSGAISRPGQTIICAPNEVLITLQGASDEVWVG